MSGETEQHHLEEKQGNAGDGLLNEGLAFPFLVGGALVLLAGLMVLLGGFVGTAAAAIVAVFLGAAAGWSADRLRLRLDESFAGSEALDRQISRQLRSIKRLAIYDPSTALYHRWYFELRVVEELHRCQRYGLPMAVLYFRLGKAPTDFTLALEGASAASRLAQITSHVVRSVDLLAHMGDLEYAVCLPHSDAAGTQAAVARLEKELRGYDAEVGFAVFPEDAENAEALVRCAQERATTTAIRRAA